MVNHHICSYIIFSVHICSIKNEFYGEYPPTFPDVETQSPNAPKLHMAGSPQRRRCPCPLDAPRHPAPALANDLQGDASLCLK